jgi:hypothetical protein
MVWIKNCQDDDWINLDQVFSISFQQMDGTEKEDWIEFLVRPSNARILEICLDVGPNPHPEDDSEISWHSRFYDRAIEVTTEIFKIISKAKEENWLWVDLQKELLIDFKNPHKDDKGIDES